MAEPLYNAECIFRIVLKFIFDVMPTQINIEKTKTKRAKTVLPPIVNLFTYSEWTKKNERERN